LDQITTRLIRNDWCAQLPGHTHQKKQSVRREQRACCIQRLDRKQYKLVYRILNRFRVKRSFASRENLSKNTKKGIESCQRAIAGTIANNRFAMNIHSSKMLSNHDNQVMEVLK